MTENAFSTFRVRVMLVDDERSLLEPLTAFLNKYFTVEGVLSGREALELVETCQGQFDVALIDETLMPGPNGIEVMKSIRKSYPNMEVIIFTGWGPEQRQNALRAGAFRYLEKPVDKHELVLLIRSAAQQVRLRSINRELLAARGLEGLQDAIINAASSLVFADDAAIIFHNPLDGKLIIHKSKVARVSETEFKHHIHKQALSQEIMQKGEIFSVPDTLADPSVDSFLVSAGIRAFIGLPVPGETGPQGVLYVYSYTPNHFDELGHTALLRTIAAQAGLALTNAWAEKQLRLHNRYMDALVHASRELSAAQSHQEMFEIAWRFVQEILGISIFFISIYDERSNTLSFPLYYDLGVRMDRHPRLLENRDEWGVTGYVIHTGEEVFWQDLAAEDDFCKKKHITPIVSGTISKSCFFYPLMMHEGVGGVISVQSTIESGLPPLYLDALRALGNHLGVAIMNLHHHEQVEHSKRMLEAVTEASQHIRSETESQHLLFETVHQAADLLAYSYGALFFFNPSLQEMELTVSYNLPENLNGTRFPANLCLAGKAAVLRKSEILLGLYRNTFPEDPILVGVDIQSALAVPIQHPNDPETQRVLLLADRKYHEVSAADLEVLERLIDTAAIAIRTSMLISGEKNRFDQLTILQKIYEFIQKRRNLDDILHLVLTGITAGYGLGFNRAALFLVDQTNNGMVGKMAIGHLDIESARLDWGESRKAGLDNFANYLQALDSKTLPETPLHKAIEGRTFGSPGKQVKTFLAYLENHHSQQIDPVELSHIPDFASIFQPVGKMVVVPLIVSEDYFGVILADNKFNLAPITSESESALITFANVAGLAIENERLLSNLHRIRDAAEEITKVSILGNLSQSLITIRESASQVLGCDMFTLYIYDSSKGKFTGMEHFGCLSESHIRPYTQLNPTSSPYKVIGLQDPYYYFTENSPEDSFLTGNFAQDERIQATLVIKVIFQGEPVGALFINYRKMHHFSKDEINTALLFADQAAITIQNARLFSRNEQQTNTLQLLYEAGKVITSSLSLNDILQLLAEHARKLTGGEQDVTCYSDVLLEKEGLLNYEACAPEGYSTRFPPVDLAAMPCGVTGRAFLSGDSQLVRDVHQDPDYLKYDPETRSELAVPLRIGQDIVGVINVESHLSEAFDESDMRNLELLAAQAVIAIQNARSYAELRKAQGIIGARTALAWAGMSASIWRHSIEKDAITIRDQAGLLRMDLENLRTLPKREKKIERVDMIGKLARRILSSPITTPLSSEEGVGTILVNSLVRERITQLWERPDFPPVTYELSLELHNDVSAWASKEWLKRALDVLVDNAVREAHHCQIKHVVIGTRLAGSKNFEIYVIDAGRGIPLEIWEKLGVEFLPRIPGSEGMGIGLMMVQIIANTYQGELVKFKTSPGGTEIGLRLPIHFPEE